MKIYMVIITIVVLIALVGSLFLIFNEDSDSCKIDQDCIDKASKGLLEPLQDTGEWKCQSSKCTWNVQVEEDLTGEVINLEVGIGDKVEF